MAISAEILTSFQKIDEAYIDSLLKKEIEANKRRLLYWMMIRQEFRRFMTFPCTQTGTKTASVRGLKRRTTCSMC